MNFSRYDLSKPTTGWKLTRTGDGLWWLGTGEVGARWCAYGTSTTP